MIIIIIIIITIALLFSKKEVLQSHMLQNIDYLHLINKTYHFKNISLRIDKS